MIDAEPCLAGCEQALAEAEFLLTGLAALPGSLEPELTSVRARIARLRFEVERLRGMSTVRTRRNIHPDWIELIGGRAPWPAGRRDGSEG